MTLMSARSQSVTRFSGLTSHALVALKGSRRTLWTPSALIKKTFGSDVSVMRPGPTSNSSPHDGGDRSAASPAPSSAFWSDVSPGSTTSQDPQQPLVRPRQKSSTGATATATGSHNRAGPYVPSPGDFDSYEEYMDSYKEELEMFKHSAVKVNDKARKTLATIKQQDRETPRKVQREYLWTFVPMMIMMCIYFNDVSNRTCAQMTQRQIEQHARSHCSVKWEKL